jgi:hypothetical protein
MPALKTKWPLRWKRNNCTLQHAPQVDYKNCKRFFYKPENGKERKTKEKEGEAELGLNLTTF